MAWEGPGWWHQERWGVPEGWSCGNEKHFEVLSSYSPDLWDQVHFEVLSSQISGNKEHFELLSSQICGNEEHFEAFSSQICGNEEILRFFPPRFVGMRNILSSFPAGIFTAALHFPFFKLLAPQDSCHLEEEHEIFHFWALKSTSSLQT